MTAMSARVSKRRAGTKLDCRWRCWPELYSAGACALDGLEGVQVEYGHLHLPATAGRKELFSDGLRRDIQRARRNFVSS